MDSLPGGTRIVSLPPFYSVQEGIQERFSPTYPPPRIGDGQGGPHLRTPSPGQTQPLRRLPEVPQARGLGLTGDTGCGATSATKRSRSVASSSPKQKIAILPPH